METIFLEHSDRHFWITAGGTRSPGPTLPDHQQSSKIPGLPGGASRAARAVLVAASHFAAVALNCVQTHSKHSQKHGKTQFTNTVKCPQNTDKHSKTRFEKNFPARPHLSHAFDGENSAFSSFVRQTLDRLRLEVEFYRCRG
jgi:hypothetical protein